MADDVKQESCADYLNKGYTDCGIAGRRLIIRLSIFIPTLLILTMLIFYQFSERFTTSGDEETGKVAGKRFPKEFQVGLAISTAFSLAFSLLVSYMYFPSVNWSKSYDGTKFVDAGYYSWFEAYAQPGLNPKTGYTTFNQPDPRTYDNQWFEQHYEYMLKNSEPLVYTNNKTFNKYTGTKPTDKQLNRAQQRQIQKDKIWENKKQRELFRKQVKEIALQEQKIQNYKKDPNWFKTLKKEVNKDEKILKGLIKNVNQEFGSAAKKRSVNGVGSAAKGKLSSAAGSVAAKKGRKGSAAGKRTKRNFGNEFPIVDQPDPGNFENYLKSMPCEYRPLESCDYDKFSQELKDKMENLGITPDEVLICKEKNGKCINPEVGDILGTSNCELCYLKTTECSANKRGYVSVGLMACVVGFLFGLGIPIISWYYFDSSGNSTYKKDEMSEEEQSKRDTTITRITNDNVWAGFGIACVILAIIILAAAIYIGFLSKWCPRGSGVYEGSFRNLFTPFAEI